VIPVAEQAKMIDFAPDLGHAVTFGENMGAARAAGAVGGVKLGHEMGYLHLVDTNTDALEVFYSNGGRLVITSNDNLADIMTLGMWGPYATAGTDRLPFLPLANTTIRFGIRFKLSAGATVVAGLTDVELTPTAAISEGIYMLGLANSIIGVVENGAAATPTAAIGTMTNDSYSEMGFVVNGVTSVDFYLDNVFIRQATMTNLPTTVQMAPTFSIKNATAAAHTATIERWSCTQTVA
jgi:hypothetical protein